VRERESRRDAATKGRAGCPQKGGAVAREMISAATVRSRAHDVKRSRRQH
jgi:hypothetical protein